ncbi:MAG: alpha/beta fold hydrolase [Planctomycetes bacterium]|nr:alpha/beta fold hydrolase [Planctomycetota bacterium]
MPNTLPLIMFPALGFDERLFRRQAEVFPQLTVPRLTDPRSGDTLAKYARRLAERIDPGGPCVLGGVSFGGPLALETARHLDARGCFLISAVRSPKQLPWPARMCRPLTWLVSHVSSEVPRFCVSTGLAVTQRFIPPASLRFARRLAQPENRFARWAAMAVMRWKPLPGDWGFPVWQIHGAQDHVLPHRAFNPDVLIDDGGHHLPLTHADEINRFLRTRIERVAAAEFRPGLGERQRIVASGNPG